MEGGEPQSDGRKKGPKERKTQNVIFADKSSEGEFKWLKSQSQIYL